jgi:hypothetical protein
LLGKAPLLVATLLPSLERGGRPAVERDICAIPHSTGRCRARGWRGGSVRRSRRREAAAGWSRSSARRASARRAWRASSSRASATATVLAGRCVSYGEGATRLPLAEMLERAGERLDIPAGRIPRRLL